MATVITNQAQLSYTFDGSSATASSNIASTVLQGALGAEKTAVSTGYRAGEDITYVVSLTNSSSGAVTDVTVTDDLGTFTQGGTSITPLNYVGPARLYINGVYSGELIPTQSAQSISFEISSIPAGGNALIVYVAEAGAEAPIDVGSVITNTVTVTAPGLAEDVTASVTLPVENYADVTVFKAMSPNPVTDGSLLTNTFTLYNYGNAPAANAVLTDRFDPELSDLTVTVNGVPVAATDYSYQNGLFTLPAAGSAYSLTVPAATFTADAAGNVITDPGVVTVVVTGTV